MWDLLEDIHAEPLAEFHHPLLMAGGAEVATLAGKRQQIFMAAIFALHTGKAVVQIAAVEITVNDPLKIWPPETILTGEPLVINMNKGFEVVLNAAVIIRILRASGAIDCGRQRHDLSP
jgi:hypothetical protein